MKVYNGRGVLLLILILLSYDIFAQKTKELNIGNHLPNISVGNVMNIKGEKIRFSDLKGKLVILDFWRVSCGSCIHDFPHLENLQKEFNDKIQVILVTSDNENQVSKLFTKLNKTSLAPDFACITSDTILNNLFPHPFAGHFVWIDKKGVVILKGISKNNTSKKVSQALKGEKIDFVSDNHAGIQYGSSTSIFKYSWKGIALPIRSYSFFIGFSDKIGDPYGGSFLNVSDSALRIVRNTLFNLSVIDFYKTVFLPFINDDWNKVINDYGINQPNDKRIRLEVKDSTKYSPLYLSSEQYTDEWMLKNLFCYEQLLPLSDSSKSLQYMQDDINRVFGDLLGITGYVEKNKFKCLVIKKLNENYDMVRSNGTKTNKDTIMLGGRSIQMVKKGNLHLLIRNMVTHLEENYLIFDETNYEGEAGMIYPMDIRTVDDLRSALRANGLDAIENIRELNVLTITMKPFSH